MKKFIIELLEVISNNFKNLFLISLSTLTVFAGVFLSNPEKFKIIIQNINYQETLQITIIFITIIFSILMFLKVFLDYLDNKNLSNYETERLHKMEREFKKLVNYNLNSTIKITENEKQELLKKLSIQFENKIADDFKNKIEERIKIHHLQTNSHNSIFRLQEEISSLNRRGNINLFIGMLLSVSGLTYLGSTVYSSTTFANYEMLFTYLAPRAFFAIFIQFFSFFFLNLYKKSLDDIKYYQNEITNLEAKYLSLDQSRQSGNFKLLANALETLNKTERNFILKKDETTIELEKSKIDAQSTNNTVQALKDIINLKR